MLEINKNSINRGEIYLINFSLGKETIIYPGLIVSNDIQNKIGQFVIILPIIVKDIPTVSFHPEIILEKKSAKIITEKIHFIEKHKIGDYLDEVDPKKMLEVEKALSLVLKISALK